MRDIIQQLNTKEAKITTSRRQPTVQELQFTGEVIAPGREYARVSYREIDGQMYWCPWIPIGDELSIKGKNITGPLVVSHTLLMKSATTITTGTYNALSVAGVSTIIADTSGGDITINGLSDWDSDQWLLIKKFDASNVLTITDESASAASDDQIITSDVTDRTIVNNRYGAFLLEYSQRKSKWFLLFES